MKAVILRHYGSPDELHLEERPTPQPKPDQIRIKVVATSVTAADARIRAARFPRGFALLARLAFGITKPRKQVLGSTYSGVVDAIGSNVAAFRVGDEVCGMTGIAMGTYAEYIVVNPTEALAHKPANVSHQDVAGMLFGGTAALYFVRDKLAVGKADTILINGASGAVGTNVVQLARYYGAEITAVSTSSHAKLLKQLGANKVIDYTDKPVSDLRQQFDVVLDAVGNISPELAKTLLTPSGRAGLMVAGLGETIRARGQVKTGTATEKSEDIAFLLSLMEQGKLTTVIDNTYPINDIVKAHKRADSPQKAGAIVINL